MKPKLLKVSVGHEESFGVRHSVALQVYNRWHYHPELELLYIEAGEGVQFIGDTIQPFKAGDILLIGSNVPHYWPSQTEHWQTDAKATVVHFRGDMWGEPFLQLPENQKLGQLIEQAQQGIEVVGKTNNEVQQLLKTMYTTPQGSQRLMLLLNILYTLANSTDVNLLTKGYLPLQLNHAETDRLSRIYAYSLQHFNRKISIDEIADVAYLSPHSFCRYFKNHTRKPFSQFLLDLRIGHAQKLLSNSHLTIAQVCLDSGFATFANFNKYFKQKTGYSPLQYRQKFNGRLSNEQQVKNESADDIAPA
jgi:AraC-like DNA-binding protein/quercetin dioxygenase-like cupin family protein